MANGAQGRQIKCYLGPVPQSCVSEKRKKIEISFLRCISLVSACGCVHKNVGALRAGGRPLELE